MTRPGSMGNYTKADEEQRRESKLGVMTGRVYFCVLLVALTVPAALAQRYTPLPPPLTVDPCAVKASSAVPDVPIDPKAKPVVCPPPAAAASKPTGIGSTAEQFPFPGDAETGNKPTVEAFPFPGDPSHKAAPATPAAPGDSKTPDPFPYPGETSKSPDAVPEGNTPRYVPDAPDSSSSSSGSGSSSSDSSAGSEVGKSDDEGGTRALPKGRQRLPKASALSPDERVTEDLDVAKFYTDRGNFQAAYLRAKDATKTIPDDAESHFALAQAAQKLQKKDEAAAEYALYLRLDPVGDKRTVAQRALAQLK